MKSYINLKINSGPKYRRRGLGGLLEVPGEKIGWADSWLRARSTRWVAGLREISLGSLMILLDVAAIDSRQQDVTDLVVWSSSNSAVITTITNGSGALLSDATSGDHHPVQ
jgi:hypothetical protein